MSKKYEIDLSILNEVFAFNGMDVAADTPEEAIKKFMEDLCDNIKSVGYDVVVKLGKDCITEIE